MQEVLQKLSQHDTIQILLTRCVLLISRIDNSNLREVYWGNHAYINKWLHVEWAMLLRKALGTTVILFPLLKRVDLGRSHEDKWQRLYWACLYRHPVLFQASISGGIVYIDIPRSSVYPSVTSLSITLLYSHKSIKGFI